MPASVAAILGGLAAVVAVGAAVNGRGAGDPGLRSDLAELARRTIYFGHQSVGVDLIEGVRELAASEGIPLRLVDTRDATAIPPGTFAHGGVAENGDPLRKLRSFEQALGTGPGVDIALVKFCYVDFDATTDVRTLFAAYRATLASLQARFPRTTFVHVTAPLTTLQGGPKAFVKRLLGRPPAGAAENARREAYNALLREATQGKEPLFDLALAESTAPDGRAETFEWQGRRIPALVPGYTGDGGHLRGEGRLRAARQLVSALASAPLRGSAPAP